MITLSQFQQGKPFQSEWQNMKQHSSFRYQEQGDSLEVFIPHSTAPEWQTVAVVHSISDSGFSISFSLLNAKPIQESFLFSDFRYNADLDWKGGDHVGI